METTIYDNFIQTKTLQRKFASATTTNPVELNKSEHSKMIISARHCDQRWKNL